MDDIKDRFKLIMEREKLTAGAFAESVGASQAAISHILSGRNKPGVDLVLRIHQRYADINLEWLLTGKGNMKREVRAFLEANNMKREDLEQFLTEQFKK